VTTMALRQDCVEKRQGPGPNSGRQQITGTVQALTVNCDRLSRISSLIRRPQVHVIGLKSEEAVDGGA